MSRPDPLAWTIGDCADGPMSAGSPGMGGNGESADAGGDEQTQAGRQHDDSISRIGGCRPNLEGFPETSRAEEQHLTTPVDRKTGGRPEMTRARLQVDPSAFLSRFRSL